MAAEAHSLTLRLARTLTLTGDLHREGAKARGLTQPLLDRTKASGVLRADIEVGDLSLIFGQLAAAWVGDRQRTAELLHRYLALMLDALHIRSAPPLPDPPVVSPGTGSNGQRNPSRFC